MKIIFGISSWYPWWNKRERFEFKLNAVLKEVRFNKEIIKTDSWFEK